MTHQNPRIDGKRWIDIGSDVNWPEYGGMWARCAGPEAPDLWYVIKLEAGEDFNDPPSCWLYEVDVADIDPRALEFAGLSPDGLDEYGDPIPNFVAYCIAAHVGFWGDHCVGVVIAQNSGDRAARYVRAVGARYMLGDFIAPGPHRFA